MTGLLVSTAEPPAPSARFAIPADRVRPLVRLAPPVSVLLTGITGFIGSHLARHLLEYGLDGRPVRLLCLVRQAHKIPIDLRPHLVLLAGDLSDLPRYRDRLCDVRYAFHLAANARALDGSSHGAAAYEESNVEGVRAVVRALEGAPLARLVHASTIGAVDRTPEDDCGRALDEASPPHPLTDYGRSKLAAERIVRESGLPHSILRITWAFGPGMNEKSHVRVFLDSVARGGAATRFRFPGRVSLISVRDLVRAFRLVAMHPEADGAVLFAAGMSDAGDAVPLGEIFARLGRLRGRRAGSVRLPRAVAAGMRRVRRHLPFAAQNLFSDVLCADAARLRALGFEPQVSLDEELLRLAHDVACSASGFVDDGPSLVTGAASGIGRALAEQHYARGERLVLVDRDAERLREVAARLDAEALVADLTDRGALERLCERVRGADDTIARLFNCAGLGVLGDVKDLDPARLRALLDVNVVALTALSQAAVTSFARRGSGTLVNIASSVSFFPLPHMAAYAASKAFVLHFTEALAEECRATPGVRVLAVCPSGTDTQFQAASGVRRVEGERMLAPWYVAGRILERCGRRDGTLLIGNKTWIGNWSARLLPRRRASRLWGRLMEKLRCPSEGANVGGPS